MENPCLSHKLILITIFKAVFISMRSIIGWKSVLTGIFAILTGTVVLQAQPLFRSFEGLQAPSSGKQYLYPDAYRLFAADNSNLKTVLSQSGTGPGAAAVLELPQPDGSMRQFRVWRSSVMETSLQEKYSAITTYTAVAADNGSVTAKLDFTLKGFHAMVYDGARTYFVDPYTDAADGFYLVYYKKDYHRQANAFMSCNVAGKGVTDATGQSPENIDGSLPHLGEKQFGSVKRLYRLALSCTGEYAVAVAGSAPTKAVVFSAMVTSINRVNGIYEREAGVAMQFIANNDTLIYLNGNTDPFTNMNGTAMLTENSTNTGTVIGATNYDIGHVFSTGGGGVAWLGSVCVDNGNIKARGVTGSPNPVGDAFDVDYVAHEMGHQFGADHTFNKCSGTEVQSAAYEPGSGSTIMAYAGICGSNNNLQQHSDAYFHMKSLDQISNYLVTGATCGQSTPSIIIPPVLPALQDTFYIPYQTPFEIEAPQASGNSLTYNWEQWDLGNYQADDTGSAFFTSGPDFRSFSPGSSRMRVFPVIDSLVKNVTSYAGEKLPKVARTLHFKACARDILSGYGAFDFSDNNLILKVINTGEPFRVTAPDLAAFQVKAATSLVVTWNVAQTDIAPISTSNVDIFLSVDGGFTYPFTLATAVPNSGSATVTLPDTVSTRSRIKVKGSGNVFFDISNNNFTIYRNVLGLQQVLSAEGLSAYPNPASDRIFISDKNGRSLQAVLYNAVGQQVWSCRLKGNAEIPVAGFGKGLYYLRFTDESNGAQAVKSVTIQ